MPTRHSSPRLDRGLGTAGTDSHPASNRLECMFHPAPARYGQMPSPARVIAAGRKRIHSKSGRTGAPYPSRLIITHKLTRTKEKEKLKGREKTKRKEARKWRRGPNKKSDMRN